MTTTKTTTTTTAQTKALKALLRQEQAAERAPGAYSEGLFSGRGGFGFNVRSFQALVRAGLVSAVPHSSGLTNYILTDAGRERASSEELS